MDDSNIAKQEAGMQCRKQQGNSVYAMIGDKEGELTLGVNHHSCCSSEEQDGKFGTHGCKVGYRLEDWSWVRVEAFGAVIANCAGKMAPGRTRRSLGN